MPNCMGQSSANTLLVDILTGIEPHGKSFGQALRGGREDAQTQERLMLLRKLSGDISTPEECPSHCGANEECPVLGRRLRSGFCRKAETNEQRSDSGFAQVVHRQHHHHYHHHYALQGEEDARQSLTAWAGSAYAGEADVRGLLPVSPKASACRKVGRRQQHHHYHKHVPEARLSSRAQRLLEGARRSKLVGQATSGVGAGGRGAGANSRLPWIS